MGQARRRAPASLALAALLSLSACGGEAAEAPNDAAPDQDVANRVATARPTPLPEAAAACAPTLSAELDRDSLVEAALDGKPSDAQLNRLKTVAGAAFAATAESLCRSGKLEPKLLAPFKTLIIQNGGGATETAFYEDPHEFSSEDLIFQWTFAESGFEIPDAADIEAGLLCWAKPDRPECAEREP